MELSHLAQLVVLLRHALSVKSLLAMVALIKHLAKASGLALHACLVAQLVMMLINMDSAQEHPFQSGHIHARFVIHQQNAQTTKTSAGIQT